MKKQVLISTMVLSSVWSFGQVGINTPDPKSTLDVSALRAANGTITDNAQLIGLHPPRLTRGELTSNTAVYNINQQGTVIYITDVTTGDIAGQRKNIKYTGYYYFDSASNMWQTFGEQPTAANIFSVGDITHSALGADNNGWYLLDGRAITTLPANAKSAAISLGFPTNLPNAANLVMKTKTGAETLGSTGGSASLTIAKANLPAITINGTVSGNTGTIGNHYHGGQQGNILLGGTSNNNNGTGQYAPNNNVMWGGLSAAAGTDAPGNHTHGVSCTVTVSSGGSGVALSNIQPYIAVNTFIYLGQ